MIDEPQSDEELADWINSQGLGEPLEDEVEEIDNRQAAFALGLDLAGCPPWSSSVKRIKDRLLVLVMTSAPEEEEGIRSSFANGQAAFGPKKIPESSLPLDHS